MGNGHYRRVGWLLVLVGVVAFGGATAARAAEAVAPPSGPYKVIADQPAPVRWATGRRKLPLKHKPVPADAQRDEAVSLHALKREGVSFQVSIGPKLAGGATVKDVTFEGLSHAGSDYTIDGDRIELKTVGLVRDRERGREWPDVLFPLGAIKTVSEGYAYTLWNTIHVPAEAPAGGYRGELRMRVAHDGRTLNFRVPVHLRVYDYTLPRDVPVTTQLFSFNAGSADRWYDFKDRAARIEYTTEKVYPRYVANRLSPGSFLPTAGPMYMTHKPYGAEGPAGRYRRFDASTGDETNFSIDQTKEFTVALRVKPAADGAGSFLTQWGGGAEGMEWRIGGEGEVNLKFCEQGESRGIETLSMSLKPGQWSHLAVSVENPGGKHTRITAYRDGERVAQKTIPGLKPSGRTLNLGSAYRTTVRPFAGALDQVRVYDRALDPQAVQRDMAGETALTKKAAFTESFSDGYSPSVVGKGYLKKWGGYWRDRGLYLNQLPIPDAWDQARLKRFFDRIYPVIESNGWGEYLYVRLPFDEATHGEKAKRNRQFAALLDKVAPAIRRHQTFGGGLGRMDKPIENALKPHAGLVDIWCSVPGHYLKPDDSPLKKWLYNRRAEHGEHLSWYIHRNIPVGNSYKDFYTVMDLRGFFWRMFQDEVTMCALWSTTNWDRGATKHQDRDPKRVERGFSLVPSTALRTGNGLLFYPGETTDDMILDSIRAQIIRDGIEDYQYLKAIQHRARSFENDAAARDLNKRIENLKARFVRFGPTVDLPPEALRALRIEMAKYLASSNR